MSQQQNQGGLSVQTLIIASLASLTAAIVVHKIWAGGAILGAAITPIIVAITSEVLKKPAQAVTSIREERFQRTRSSPRVRPEGERAAPATGAQRPAAPPPPEFERPDPFGIWQADKPSWRDRLRGRPLKVALATGLAAFAIVAFALTGSELVFGGGVGGGGDRLTIVPGKQKKSKSARDRDRQEQQRTPTTEQPATTAPAAPEEQAPEEEAPAETTPTAPEETTPAPPEETTPEEAPAQPEAPAPTP